MTEKKAQSARSGNSDQPNHSDDSARGVAPTGDTPGRRKTTADRSAGLEAACAAAGRIQARVRDPHRLVLTGLAVTSTTRVHTAEGTRTLYENPGARERDEEALQQFATFLQLRSKALARLYASFAELRIEFSEEGFDELESIAGELAALASTFRGRP